MSRVSNDEYFLDIADAVSSRATCPRKKVGVVLVRDKMIISTGYNGSLAGAHHCDDHGCIIENNHCIRVVHAEANAIYQAAKRGVTTAYSIAYITCNPCINCFMALYQAGVKRIIYRELYKPVDYNIFGLSGNQMPDISKFGNDDSRRFLEDNY